MPSAGTWVDLASTATQNATAGVGTITDLALITGNAVPVGSTLQWQTCMWVDPAAPGCATPTTTYSTTVNSSGFFSHPDLPTPTVADLPAGTLVAYFGWAPVLTSPSGQVLDREPFGTPAQTTTITAMPPAMSSTATQEAGPGDPASDTVTLAGPTRADWTIGWELCWLTNGACPDGTAFTAGDPQQIDPAVDTYTFELPDGVEVPEGTAPGAHLTLGWAPVIRDVDGDEVTREAWGAPGQTTAVDYPLPSMTSKATASGPLGSSTQDVVDIVGPVLEGSRISWPGCYTIDRKTCADGSTPVAPGPVQADGSVGIVLPALAVGETYEVTGPEHELTIGGLLPNAALAFTWTPVISTPDGHALVSEAPGIPAQTTTVEFPPVTAVTQAYASSPDGPWYGDGLGDRVTVAGDVFVGDTVTVRLYAWPTGSEPICQGEPLAQTVLELDASTSTYDTGLIYTTPADRTDLTYGFVETTHSRGADVVSECGLAAETVTPRVNPNGDGGAAGLAETGARNVGALFALATLLGVVGGSLTRAREKHMKKARA
ncbi:MAG: hypothetical protein HGA44_05785 [Cellulomonadaceae bacterium]|nr:hypothetical protein [Cellulomonadaceae bacterium]